MRKLFVMILTVLAMGLVATLAQEGTEIEGATLQVADHETFGAYLTDAGGQSLYLFLNDTENTSNCYDQCAENWPPLLADDEPVAGEGVDASLLGTTQRDDEATQVTYNGWPLYYFARDENAGDTTGQGVGEVWYLVTTEGAPVGVEDEEDASEESEDEAELGEEADNEELFVSLMDEGEEVYRRICSTCHGAQGGGGAGVRLVGHPRLEDEQHVADVIIRGFGYMPPFGDQLSDREVAAVATYVRNSWGNEFGLVTEEEVMEIR